MDFNAVYSSNKDAVSDSIINLICIAKYNDFCTSINNSQCEKKQAINQTALNLTRKNNTYLSINVIQKMVQRFLVEKKMSKKKLANILAVTVGDLDRIFSKGDLSRLIAKINLPLIKLYCKTWNE